MAAERKNLQATCPRCGYDQRGVMAAWTRSCPLASTCAECGLEFEWREIFDPTLSLPRWCIEHRRAALAIPRQFIATAVRCWLSLLLWRQVQMIHRLNRRRLRLWLLTWCVVLVASAMLANGLTAVGHWRAAVSSGRTASTGPWPVFFQAAGMPLSNRSIGTFTLTMPPFANVPLVMRPSPYPTPLHHFHWQIRRSAVRMILLAAIPLTCACTFAALPVSRRRAKVRWTHIARAAVYLYGLTFTVAALWFMLDVDELLRPILSSPQVTPLTPAAGPAAGPSPAQTVASIAVLGLTIFASAAWVIVVAFTPAVLVFWWACAQRYLRMQQPWAVALSVTIIGLLAPVSLYGLLWYWLG